MESKPLLVYIVYDHPADYPNDFIVRRDMIRHGLVERDEKFFFQSSSLDTVREMMHTLGLVCMTRMAEDDEAILETWM